MPQLPALRYSNALVDFSPVSNALDANRKNALEQRDSARQDEMLGLRRQEFDYNRQRTDKADARAQIERGAQMASAIGSMSDNDPAKQAAWKRYLSEYGDGDHTPEELDFRTGPKIAAAAAGKFLDPRDSQMKDLELQKTRAEIGRLNSQAAAGGGETPSDIREWLTFKRMSPEDQQRYLTMKRAEKYLDLGTSYARPDPTNPAGPPMATFQKDVAGEAAQKEMGEAQGKATADLPRQEDNATLALKTITDIRNHPGKSWGTGATGIIPGIPGTEQRGFVNLVDQAKGQVFLQAFNSLRGGGQITEAEGAKATQALARLDRAQSPKDFDAALDDLEEIINAGLSRARVSTGGRAGPQPAANTYKSRYGLE